MLSRPAALILTLALIAAGGCAANRPRVPPRIIDDPATLPPGMVWLGGTAQVNSMVEPAAVRGWNHSEGAELRFGVTRRLELVDILALRLAVLDDSPARPDPDTLTFAVKAGLANVEIGDDFHPEADYIPVVRLDAGKRVAPRWRLGAYLAQRSYMYTDWSLYAPTVASAGVEGLYQLTELVALRAGLQGYRWTASPRPWRPTSQGGFGPNLWLGVRPSRWVTLAASASLVFASVDESLLPSPHPERSAAEARLLFAGPRYRIAIVGAQAILHH
jgi:hypothetical protein